MFAPGLFATMVFMDAKVFDIGYLEVDLSKGYELSFEDSGKWVPVWEMFPDRFRLKPLVIRKSGYFYSLVDDYEKRIYEVSVVAMRWLEDQGVSGVVEFAYKARREHLDYCIECGVFSK
jgi:hypothetical protein